MQKEDDLLQEAIVAIENEVERFLPVEAEIIRCDAEVELVLDEGLKDVVDKTDEVVEGIAIGKWFCFHSLCIIMQNDLICISISFTFSNIFIRCRYGARTFSGK